MISAGLFVVFLLVALLVYLVWLWYDVSIPSSGYSQPNLLRGIHFFGRATGAWCKFRCLFGGTVEDHQRALQAWIAKHQISGLPKSEKEKVNSEDTKFDDVDVRIYRRNEEVDSGRKPAVVYYHGGGWCYGSLDLVDAFCREVVKGLDVVLVSVGYRLVDQKKGIKFPIPMQDCVAATKHLLERASHYGVDASRVALMGDSAGGNLAAVVSLKLRDESFLPLPKLQLLLYPAMQAVDLAFPSYQQNQNALLLSGRVMVEFWSKYVTGSDALVDDMLANQYAPQSCSGRLDLESIDRKYLNATYRRRPAGKEWAGRLGEFAQVLLDPYCCPLLAENLSGLPEAYIFTAEHDVLRDDGLLYARQLEQAGVKVHHVHSQNGFHGMFSVYFMIPEVMPFLQSTIDYLADRL